MMQSRTNSMYNYQIKPVQDWYQPKQQNWQQDSAIQQTSKQNFGQNKGSAKDNQLNSFYQAFTESAIINSNNYYHDPRQFPYQNVKGPGLEQNSGKSYKQNGKGKNYQMSGVNQMYGMMHYKPQYMAKPKLNPSEEYIKSTSLDENDKLSKIQESQQQQDRVSEGLYQEENSNNDHSSGKRENFTLGQKSIHNYEQIESSNPEVIQKITDKYHNLKSLSNDQAFLASHMTFKVLTPLKSLDGLINSNQKEDNIELLIEQSVESTFPSDSNKSENEDIALLVNEDNTSKSYNSNVHNSAVDNFFDMFTGEETFENKQSKTNKLKCETHTQMLAQLFGVMQSSTSVGPKSQRSTKNDVQDLKLQGTQKWSNLQYKYFEKARCFIAPKTTDIPISL